jgi:hypothetical protein
MVSTGFLRELRTRGRVSSISIILSMKTLARQTVIWTSRSAMNLNVGAPTAVLGSDAKEVHVVRRGDSSMPRLTQ